MAAVQMTGVVMMSQYVRCCSHSDACCMWKIEAWWRYHGFWYYLVQLRNSVWRYLF